MKSTSKISCYEQKKPYEIEFQGQNITVMKGHVCEDGACVPTDIDNEDCIDSPGSAIDPYADLDPVLQIKLLGEKEWHSNVGFGSLWNVPSGRFGLLYVWAFECFCSLDCSSTRNR